MYLPEHTTTLTASRFLVNIENLAKALNGVQTYLAQLRCRIANVLEVSAKAK